MTSYPFLKMAAVSHIGFDLVMLDQPRSVIVGPRLIVKFGLNPIYSSGDIAIIIFYRFGLKMPIHTHVWGFWAYFSQIWSPVVLTPIAPSLHVGIAIPESQTVFQSQNPGIMKDQIPGFQD